MLIIAVISMFGALFSYTYAVFDGLRKGLSLRHLLAFGTGLALDYYGTHLMSLLITTYGKPPALHGYSGKFSLWGMAFHFTLAMVATVFGEVSVVNRIFHRVSRVIYFLGLIAFISGAMFGMLVKAR
ncbi:MAG TPA: TIGR03987 family protein [Bacillota bacterium]|nr:TIGR03987 family protein [Bacillota bacterium]